jgi:uncharacterized protein YifE (UPF0438 family)
MTTKKSIYTSDEKSFSVTRKFYDDKNYPRGMSRSGDYSVTEVTILETYGIALLEISSGKRQPTTEEEINFKAVCSNEQNADTAIEKAWMKYQNKVLTPKQFHTLFGNTRTAVDDAETTQNAELDLDD